MSRITWTPALDAKVRDAYPDSRTQDLAKSLGCTVSVIYNRAGILGVAKSPIFTSENTRANVLARSLWTPALLEILDLMYPVQRTGDLAELIGLPMKRLYPMARKRGLHKSMDLVRQMAREKMTAQHPAKAYQFKPGLRPWNKGRKGINYPGMQATQFKPGSRPHTWKPIGSTRVMDGYLQRKMTDTGYPPHDWRPVHVLLWEETHGPIPAGHALAFKDGDRTHIVIDNLELLSRGELMRRNSLHTTMPPELRQLVQLRGVLTRQINKQPRATS